MEQPLKDYPKDVRIVYMQHPLSFHQYAGISAEAVMAANSQGKFEPMHEKLMALNGQLAREKILAAAQEIGLDMKKFTADLDNDAHKGAISAMTNELVKIGATGTPASFINGRYLSGAQPVEAFKKLIDEELNKANVAGGTK
jgi:predicted DsbA family dithiol-disulfide isomerase